MAKNQRLDATITIGSVLQGAVKRNFNVLRAGLDSVGDEIKKVADRQRELSRQRKVLEKEGRAVDHLDREYEELGRTLDTLRRKQQRLERAQVAAGRVGREFGRAVSDVGRLARNASIAVGAASAAVFGLASSTAAAGDEFAKQSRALGFGVEAYQELQFAAERSGVSQDTFNSSMVAFTKRLGEAAQGTGAARKALDQLNLSAEDLISMEPDAALELIADRMQDIEDPADRAAIAAQLFSRAGVRMVGMLGDGSEGLRELRQEARDLGLVLSEESTTAAEEYQDQLLNAQMAAKGLKNTVGSALMPVVSDAMRDFTSFMKSNRDSVETFADAAADGLRRAIPVVGDLARGVASVGAEIGQGIGQLADFVGGWENLGVVVGGLMASRAIVSVGRFVGSIFGLGRALWALGPGMSAVAVGVRAVGAALLANPIGLTIALIAGGAALIIANWETVEPKLKAVAVAIGTALATAWDNVIKPVIDGLASAGSAIVEGWRSVKSGLGEVIDWIGDKFDWLWQKIEPVINGLTFLRDKGAAAINSVGSIFGGADDGPAPDDPQGPRPFTRRAIGGAFSAGRGLIVGEQGPELMFPTQGGFIAHNRQLERMADLTRSILSRGAAAMHQGGQAAAQITQNITVNAQGASAREVAEEIDRLRRGAQERALFDPTIGFGQYGEAF